MEENEVKDAGSVDLDDIFDDNQLAAMSEELTEKKPAKEKSVETPDETTEDDDGDLFEEPSKNPETVSGGKEKTKESPASTDSGASPEKLYSSIAADLVEDGALSNLTPEEAENIKSADDLLNAMKNQVNSMLDEAQQRINKALDNDVEPSLIKQYEGFLAQLNNITSDQISASGDNGERLRRTIMMRDFQSRGFSQEKAKKFVDQSFAAGTDIDDAKEALTSLVDKTKKDYNGILAEAEKEKRQEVEEQKKRFDTLKTQIMNEKLLGELELDKSTRTQIFNNATRIIHTNKETGETYTALEKFQEDDPVGFLKLMSVAYTLTDGGKNMDKLIAQPVSKAVSKKVSNLEKTLNNTQRGADGTLKFINHNTTPDANSHYSEEFDVNA